MEQEIDEVLSVHPNQLPFAGTLLGFSLITSLLGVIGNALIIAVVVTTKQLHEWTYIIVADIAVVELINLIMSQLSITIGVNNCVQFSVAFVAGSVTLVLLTCFISERLAEHDLPAKNIVFVVNGIFFALGMILLTICLSVRNISHYFVIPFPFIFLYLLIVLIVRHIQRCRSPSVMTTPSNIRLAIASVYVLSSVLLIVFAFILPVPHTILIIGFLLNLESYGVLLTAYILDRNFKIGLLRLFRQDTSGYNADNVVVYDEENRRVDIGNNEL